MKRHERGLKMWEKRLKHIQKSAQLDCPVCKSLGCYQFLKDGTKGVYATYVSDEAKEKCPLAHKPKLCRRMREAMIHTHRLQRKFTK